MRAVTTGDYFFKRYDKSVVAFYAVVGLLQLMVNFGVMLKGSSAIITAVSRGAIDPYFAKWAITLIRCRRFDCYSCTRRKWRFLLVFQLTTTSCFESSNETLFPVCIAAIVMHKATE